MGNELSIKETTPDARGFEAVERVWLDLRYALRSLLRSPGFSVIACAALALGIGATTAVFTVVRGVLLRPLPYPDAERLVMVWERPPHGNSTNVVAMDNFVDWRERNQSFQAMAAFNITPMNLLGDDEAVQITGAAVTADFFRVIGVAPLLGRAFEAGEDAANAAPTIVLSHGLWQGRFGGRADVIGRRISVNARHREVIGVMPAGYAFPNPLVQAFVVLPAVGSGGRNHSVVARLRPGMTLGRAQEEMKAIAARTAEERPQLNANWSATVVPLYEQMVGETKRPLLVLFAAVVLVLVLGCANIANLLLIRSTARLREMTIRRALGAGQWRLLHQMLVESLVLAGVGAAVGVAVAWWSVRTAVRLMLATPSMKSLPRLDEISLDPWVLGFAAVVTVAVAVLFGLVPTLVSGRRDLNVLSLGSRSVTGRRRLQSAMVVVEIALALPLLVAASLLVHSLVRLNQIDPGFRTEGVLTVRMLLLPVRDRALHADFIDQVLERVRALPDVVAAGSIGRLPMEGGNSGSWYYRADRPEPALSERPAGDISIITPGYFQAMGIPLVRGRDFSDRDRMGSPHVAILNQTAAREFFGDENPLGQHVKVWWNDAGVVEIVGVAADIRHSQLQTKPDPCLFLANAQQPFPFSALVIRTLGNPLGFAGLVKREVRGIDPDQGITEIHTMEELVETSIARPRALTILFGVFGFLALTLTSIGLYGVLAYSVTQRTREIGVRVALGASPGAAFGLVLRDGMRLAAAGLAIGLGVALALTRFMQGLLFEVEPLDPAAFAGVTTLLTVVACLACGIPAGRATRIDPAIVLRNE
jgi:putative ABC transport system permease protein